VSLPRDMATVSESKWELEIRRSRVMDELLVRGSAASVSDAAREHSLSIALMHRLRARYRRNLSPGALLPGTVGPAAGFRRLEPGVETVVQREIDSFYPSKERPRVADVRRRIAIEYRRQNIQGPSYRAIWTRIRALDPATVVRHRAKRFWRLLRERLSSAAIKESVRAEHWHPIFVRRGRFLLI
jgi:putative transposase